MAALEDIASEIRNIKDVSSVTRRDPASTEQTRERYREIDQLVGESGLVSEEILGILLEVDKFISALPVYLFYTHRVKGKSTYTIAQELTRGTGRRFYESQVKIMLEDFGIPLSKNETMSDAKKESWQDPLFRVKTVAGIREKWQDPDYRASREGRRSYLQKLSDEGLLEYAEERFQGYSRGELRRKSPALFEELERRGLIDKAYPDPRRGPRI